MPQAAPATIHASAVLVGARAILIRGPAGSGKSSLAFALIEAAMAGHVPFARLVGDDRVIVEAVNGRLLARAPERLAGLIELRGLGIRCVPFEPEAVINHIVDLAAEDAARLPQPEGRQASIAGIALPRLAVAPGDTPLPLVLGLLRTQDSGL